LYLFRKTGTNKLSGVFGTNKLPRSPFKESG
jgi:hypothetical protein